MAKDLELSIRLGFNVDDFAKGLKQFSGSLNSEFAAMKSTVDRASANFAAAIKKMGDTDPFARSKDGAKAAASEYAHARQALDSATSSMQALKARAEAFGTLKVRPFADIEAEIAKVRAAFDTLKNSGTLSAHALAQAHVRMNEEVRGLQGETNGWTAALGRAKAGAIALGGAFAAAGAMVKQSMDMESLAAKMKYATGSAEGAAKALKFTSDMASRLGIDAMAAANGFSSIAAASKGTSLEGEKTQKIFESIATASRVMGLSSDQMGGALKAIQQMMSKGVVSAEEFRGQLGDHLPGATRIAAEALGVTEQAFANMLESGQIISQDFLPKFAQALQNAVGADAQTAAQSTAAQFARLGNHVRDIAVALGGILLPAINLVVGGLSEAAKWVAEFANAHPLITSLALASATLAAGWSTLVTIGLALKLALSGMAEGMKAFAAGTLLASVSLQTLKAAFGPLVLALSVGWEVGKWLNGFTSVKIAGTYMIQGLMTGLSFLQLAWESFVALFTSDTVSAAATRHAERLTQISTISQQMRDDINSGITESAAASAQAAAATEAAAARSKQALADEAAAWKSLNDGIKTQYADRLASLDALLQQQTALIAATATNETAKEAATTAAIMAAHVERLALIKSYQTEALALIEQEKTARLAAVKASGETEKQINGEAMTAKRALLAGLLGEYQNHFNSLNAQYSAHLAHVNQIEAAKRAAVMGAEEAIREMARSTMTARQAYADQQKQIDELQAKARQALEEGNFKLAQEYSEKAIGLAKTTANEVKQGDQVIIDKRQAVATATNQVKESLELMKKAYDGQGEAAKGEAAQTLQAMNDTKSATENLRIAVQTLDTALSAQHALTVKTNIPQVRAEIKSLDGQNTSGTHTIYVTKVEKNATGGLVGSGVNRYASGGLVQKFATGGGVFKKPGWNKVPGSGNGDTVPAALQAGSYVLKKSASQYYGDGLLGRVASGVQKFAWGGLAKWGGGASVAEDPLSALRARVADLISKYSLVAKGKVFLNAASNDLAFAKDEESLKNLGKRVAAALFNGSIYESTVLAGTNRRKSAELGALANWAYAQKFASGGHAAGSDTVPAMLTPGEWVVKKSAVDKYGLGLLDDLNNMRIPKAALSGGHAPRIARFAEGGKVGGMSAMASSSAKTSQASGISLTVNAPTGNADDIVRALVPALNRLATKSR